jgi:hypothetical protein
MLLPRHAEAQRRRVHRHEHIESSINGLGQKFAVLNSSPSN